MGSIKQTLPGVTTMIVKSEYGKALALLAKRFECGEDTFEQLSRQTVIQWANDLRSRDTSLGTWQHRFLVGEDISNLHRNKLIEHLSGASLAACATATGRTVQQLL